MWKWKLLEKFIMAVILAMGLFFALATVQLARASEWEPTKPIEFVVPVGCCVGGANDIARMVKSITEKYNFASQPIVVINKPTGPASEGYVYLKNHAGNAHVIGLAITSVFTHSIANPAAGFTYTDITPVTMLALDQFALWVPADAPYVTSQDFIQNAAKNPGTVSVGGLSVKQEDQIVTVAIEQAKSVSFNYVPYKVGGEIALQLAGKHIDASVNNPSEGLPLWQAGKLKPLCIFDSVRILNKDFVTATQSWNDVPTCREQNLDVQYKMMRSVFAPPGIPTAAVTYYQDLLTKVSNTPEWKQYLRQNALEPQLLTGDKFNKWLAHSYQQHKDIMTRSGLATK
jgi:putative tricarboxylic transport membrane protein